MPTLQELAGQIQSRGFIPNPWWWDQYLQGQGVRAFPAANMLAALPAANFAAPAAPSFAAVAPSLLQQFGPRLLSGLSPENTDLGRAMADASSFLNLGTNIAQGNVPGAIGSGLRSASALTRMGGFPGASGTLNALGGPLTIGLGLAQGNPLGAASGVPATLSGLGGLATAASGLGPIMAGGATAAELAALGATGAEIAAASPVLAGLGSGLSTAGSIAALPVAIASLIALNQQFQSAETARRKAEETGRIQEGFAQNWPRLSQIPNTMESLNRLGLLGQAEQLDTLQSALRESRAAISALPAVSQYLGTQGGKQSHPLFTYPGVDVSGYAAETPALTSQAYLAQLRAGDLLAQRGVEQPPLNLMPEGYTGRPVGFDTAIDMSPEAVVSALRGYGGLPTDIYPYGREREREALFEPQPGTYSDEIYTPGAPTGYGPLPPGRDLADFPEFLEGYNTPGQQLASLVQFFQSQNPNFAESALGQEYARFGSTGFPGQGTRPADLPAVTPMTATTTPGAGSPSPGARAGAGRAEPSAIAFPLETSGGLRQDSLDQSLEGARAFLGVL